MTLITYSKLASAVALAFALGACNPMTVQETAGSAQQQKAGTISPATAQTTAMDQFISELISKMTIEEKVGQLNLLSSDWDKTGPTLSADYQQQIKAGKVGAVFNCLYSKLYA
jgi:beta-glucosidase